MLPFVAKSHDRIHCSLNLRTGWLVAETFRLVAAAFVIHFQIILQIEALEY